MLSTIFLVVCISLVIAAILYLIFSDVFKFDKLDSDELPKLQLNNGVDLSNFQNGLSSIEINDNDILNFVNSIQKHIFGMSDFVNAMIVGILSQGHILVEGVPGLAKTKTINIFSRLLDLDFKRVQFTPDMMPSDLLGVEIFNQQSRQFETRLGPIMTNVILADEINRTTPKVQSALLEAMQEYQVTIAGTTYKLDKPFFVLATQNPLEHEGTFPLPEAQIDRFLFKVNVTYPTHNDEKKIVVDNSNDGLIDLTPILNKDLLKNKFDKISKITVDDQIVNYAVRLTNATRDKKTGLDYGASPRGSISLVRAAKSVAFLEGRDYVVHKDIQSVALLVMRHRVIRNYDFDMEGNSIDDILLKIFSGVALSE